MSERKWAASLAGILGIAGLSKAIETGASPIGGAAAQEMTYSKSEPPSERRIQNSGSIETSGQEPQFPITEYFSHDRLTEEDADVVAILNNDPEITDRYYALIDALTQQPLPDGGTRFTVPETNFSIDLRVVNEDGQAWLACEGPGCVQYAEVLVDGRPHVAQVGYRTELGAHETSPAALATHDSVAHDLRQLLVGYAQADVYGAKTPMVQASEVTDEQEDASGE